MDGKELQIGDYIEAFGVIRMVAGIFGGQDFLMLDTYIPSLGYRESTLSFRGQYANPITLTGDILLKSGFEVCAERIHYTEYRICLNEDTDEERWVFVELHKSDYMKLLYTHYKGHADSIELVLNHCSVHQLQHALRLCGLGDTVKIKMGN